MNLHTLSDRELHENLQSLLRVGDESGAIDQLQASVQSLEGHRLELEMQNRALREMQVELEHSMRRYVALYDPLPIGYLTFSRAGRILEANATASEWLRRPSRRGGGAELPAGL